MDNLKGTHPPIAPNKMQQLALDVKQLETQLAVCTSCGMCQANCPVFAQTKKEADVSRGKIALINGLIQEMFEESEGVYKRLQKCLLCGTCSYECPSNVNTVDIFLKARSIIAQYQKLPFLQKIIFKNQLSKPTVFNNTINKLTFVQNFFFKNHNNLQGTSCARITSPILRGRNIVPFKTQSFSKTLNGKDLKIDGKGLKIAFFTGCLIDKIYPDIAHSLIYVLKHFNAQIFIPLNQGCCGIPAIASGSEETFETLIKTNVKLFLKQDYDYIVTACATCTSTIKHLWPSMFKTEDKTLLQQIKNLASKTVDISWLMEKHFDQFAATLEKPKPDNINSDKKTDKKKLITYHDPCHLKKSLGIYKEPRNTLKASGYELREMVESDTCCGMGGSFNLKHYDISSRIGLQKAQNIIDTGCSTVATSCPACMMQISDMLTKLNQSIDVKHPIQIYAQALKNCNKK